AVCLHPELTYELVEAGGERYLMAAALVDSVAAQLGWSQPKRIQSWKGAELEGLRSRHPFADRFSPVILGEHVTLEQGTGCVHTAPGHGIEDYEVGVRYGLDVFSPVDGRGRFTEEAGPYAGQALDE